MVDYKNRELNTCLYKVDTPLLFYLIASTTKSR